MLHQVLLISADEGLARRVRQALPAKARLELHCEPAVRAGADEREWLLVMADERVAGEAWAHRGAPAASSGSGPAGAPPPPLIWFAASARTSAAPFRAGAIDCVQRDEPASKLAFVLRQHLTAARLRLVRARSASLGRQPEAERGQLADLLTGILGNAELALSQAERLPAPLRARLERIQSLSGALRDLLTGAEAEGHPAAAAPIQP